MRSGRFARKKTGGLHLTQQVHRFAPARGHRFRTKERFSRKFEERNPSVAFERLQTSDDDERKKWTFPPFSCFRHSLCRMREPSRFRLERGSNVRLTHVLLVLVDISGYTRFITERSLALSHAEQIITELLEAVINRSRHPMQLNKLEGDAALLFGEVAATDVVAARDAFAQIGAFFTVFDACRADVQAVRSNCDCPACTNISVLSLKAFVHSGEIAIKQVQRFEELAGEPVIQLHRMTKNDVAERVYVLCTSQAAALAQLDPAVLKPHSEDLAGFGPTPMWLIDPTDLPASPVAG